MVTVLNHKGGEVNPCHEAVARQLTKQKHAFKGRDEDGGFYVRCFTPDDESFYHTLTGTSGEKEG